MTSNEIIDEMRKYDNSSTEEIFVNRFLFVGEKPSPTAHQRDVVWADGGLAAKQLFDALRRLGIDPTRSMFFNLFGNDPDAVESATVTRITLLNEIAYVNRLEVVAMGQKVARGLRHYSVPHRTIVHPAARGTIRGKNRYYEHLRDILVQPTLV